MLNTEEDDSYAEQLVALGDAGDLLRAFEQVDEGSFTCLGTGTAELVLVDSEDQKTMH